MGNHLDDILLNTYDFFLIYYPNIVSGALDAIDKGVPLRVALEDRTVYIDPIKVLETWDEFAHAIAQILIAGDIQNG